MDSNLVILKHAHAYNTSQHDRQCTYNVTLGALTKPLLPCKSNKYYIFSVCVCACVHVGEGMPVYACVRAGGYRCTSSGV